MNCCEVLKTLISTVGVVLVLSVISDVLIFENNNSDLSVSIPLNPNMEIKSLRKLQRGTVEAAKDHPKAAETVFKQLPTTKIIKRLRDVTDCTQTTTIAPPITVQVCFEEILENLTWPETSVGSVAVPKNCTESYIIRYCSYDQNNVPSWGEPSGDVHQCDDNTITLFELANSFDSKTAIQKLRSISYNFDDLISEMQVQYSSLILKRFSENEEAIQPLQSRLHFFTVISNILDKIPERTLHYVQSKLNSTDIILDSIETVLSYYSDDFTFDGYLSVRQKKLDSSTIGWMVGQDETVTSIPSSFSLDDIKMKQPTIAAYISNYSELGDNVKATFVCFKNSKLFNSEDLDVNPWIVRMDASNSDLQILFQSQGNSIDDKWCSYWLYGRKNNVDFGYWFGDSNVSPQDVQPLIFICDYSHMGYFGVTNTTHRITHEAKPLLIKEESIIPQCSTTLSPIPPKYCPAAKYDELITWPKTFAGSIAIPMNCSETVYTRKCLYDTKETYWEKPKGQYTPCDNYTAMIYNLFISNDSNMAIQSLSNIFVYGNEMVTKYSVEILKKYSRNITALNSNSSLCFFQVIDNILKYNDSDLTNGQINLNSTDSILDSIDAFLYNYNQDFTRDTENYYIRKGRLNKSNIGWMITDNNTINPITNNISLIDIIDRKPIVASFFSNYKEVRRNVNASFIFFRDLKLFKVKQNLNVYQWVASVDTSNPIKHFSSLLHIIYRQSNTTLNRSCAYWLYGQNENNIDIFGSWYRENTTINNQQYLICNYTHMTHFGMLINENIPENIPLDILTYIGIGLSICGVIGVLISTYLQKNVRIKKSMYLLLNYLLSIILLPIALYISSVVTGNILCKLSGMFLHYIIISQSVWSLILATFQYRRYVIVYQNYKRYILNKSLIIGWLTGTIPIIILCSVSLDYYHKNESKLCYLNQTLINYAVIFPILVITTSNFLIFTFIIYSITNSKRPVRKAKIMWSILKLVHFLFYLFGLSWIVGILLLITRNIYISYLFTILTSLQGFAICIHYIITSQDKLRRVKQSVQTSKVSSKSASNQNSSFD